MYSPLEQFDQTNWLFNRIFETKQAFLCFVSEIEFDSSSLSTNSYSFFNFNKIFASPEGIGSFVQQSVSQLDLTYVFIFFIFPYIINFTLQNVPVDIPDFSYLLSFLVVINLFTGFFISNWFFDFIFINQLITDNLNLDLTANSINFNYVFASQIDFSFSFDEILITFILGSLFITNNEENSDFIRAEKADLLIVENIVAPLFVSNIGKDVEENGALYLKVCTIFSFVLISNLLGIIPYGDTATSSLILTFWVALSVFVAIVVLIIQKHGIEYFFGLFRPKGCPLPLVFLLVPIEFLSYSFRLVSLAIRLFANIMAGHTLRKVLIGFSYIIFLLGDGFALAAFFSSCSSFCTSFSRNGCSSNSGLYFFYSVLYLSKRTLCRSLIK